MSQLSLALPRAHRVPSAPTNSDRGPDLAPTPLQDPRGQQDPQRTRPAPPGAPNRAPRAHVFLVLMAALTLRGAYIWAPYQHHGTQPRMAIPPGKIDLRHQERGDPRFHPGSTPRHMRDQPDTTELPPYWPRKEAGRQTSPEEAAPNAKQQRLNCPFSNHHTIALAKSNATSPETRSRFFENTHREESKLERGEKQPLSPPPPAHKRTQEIRMKLPTTAHNREDTRTNISLWPKQLSPKTRTTPFRLPAAANQ